MTEQEFLKAQSAGQVEQVPGTAIPSVDLSAIVADLQGQMRDYIPLLERLRKTETAGGSSLSPALSLLNGYPLYSASATSIDVTGLDLDTDLLYQIIVECRNTTNAGILEARVNNDNTGGRHIWASHGNKYNGASNEDNPGGASGSSPTKWDISHSAGNRSHHSSILLGYNGGTPLAQWNTASIGDAGAANDTAAIENGAGFWNHTDNITSITFTHNSGANCEWKIWVFKAALQ